MSRSDFLRRVAVGVAAVGVPVLSALSFQRHPDDIELEKLSVDWILMNGRFTVSKQAAWLLKSR